MNPPGHRGYPVPFVAHSGAAGRNPVHQLPQPQPPIVVDVQRIIDHMKGDFRAEFQAFKVELLAAVRAELQDWNPPTNQNISEDLYQMVRKALKEVGTITNVVNSVATNSTSQNQPLFVPSDLLAPREGSVSVNTKVEDQGTGNLDAAADMLRKVKRGQK